MFESLLRRAVVIPVIALDSVHDAVPLARCLVDAGLTLIEITLRTPAGLPALRAIRDANVGIDVAIGTVRSVDDMRAAARSGAVAMISPGTTPALIEAARDATLPWLPGVATASEVMTLADAGYRIQKLFPSRFELVDALAGPFPDVMLVPTGGVAADNAPDYLARTNVIAVSGSWIAPRRLIAEHAWDEIGRCARAAAAFATGR
ncbi:MAG TPA: bifunctional 4-hydroxy-2-oxoglutarate aldolase/2-dehydro-3-deoxy-phosphogluconate aldolase [Pseudomonadales bacterium]|nr:bifunctional 4-hydroxy-2-oxoglutarate aldolase/2-dehydro-3-deoxy-phosphogluconate aldolase [Pseudomonadales bacterium]